MDDNIELFYEIADITLEEISMLLNITYKQTFFLVMMILLLITCICICTTAIIYFIFLRLYKQIIKKITLL